MGEKPKLGEILRAEGLIDEQQLRLALGEQARWGRRLGETLVRMGFVSEEELVRTLSRRFGVPGVNLAGKTIEPHVLDLVTAEVAEKHSCLPLFVKQQGGVRLLYLGMDDPSDLAAIDDLSFRTGLGIRPVVAGPLQIRDAIATFYRGDAPSEQRDAAIPEAPLLAGDTAPVLPDLAPDAEEARAGESGAAWAAQDAEADAALRADGAAASPKPREVPTRQILKAVTRLLIEKQIITREELLETVRALQTASPESGAIGGSSES